MPFDQTRIAAILPKLSLVDGQDDATATAALSVGVKVPRPERITATTAGAALGAFQAAALQAGLRKAAASSDPQIAALGDYALGLLLGPGFDANDPSVPSVVQAFVGGGICSQEAADAILYIRTDYPCGFIPTQDEVIEARRQAAANQVGLVLRQRLGRAFLAASEQVAAFERGDTQSIDWAGLLTIASNTQ